MRPIARPGRAVYNAAMRMRAGVALLAIVIAAGMWFAAKRAVYQPNEIYAYSLLIDAGLHDRLASAWVESGSPGEVPPSEPPGYVAFVAAIYRLGYSYTAVKLIQCGLLGLTALVVAVVVRRLVGVVEAVLVAAIAMLPIGRVIRRAAARPRTFALMLAVCAIWGAAAGAGTYPTRMRLEAEELDGFTARTVLDERAVNGRARMAPADGGVREAVRLSGEFLPRGAYGVRVRARTTACATPERAAMTVVVRNAERAAISSRVFTARDLCRGDDYVEVIATGALDHDQLAYVAVETAEVDLWVDRLDLLLARHDAGEVLEAARHERGRR